MTNMTMQTAVVKACQLSSIIAVMDEYNPEKRHCCNLIGLANEIAGDLATFLMEKEGEEE
ncbi:hypothetical protein E4Y68_24895 [Salmonella enterica]|nr:hypothetical protein [Salmonella enterica]EBQ2130917.1 hypothetical protein [Salmonella enterica]EEH8737569.1 hypothetical protein [Salmonella enterica]